MRRGGGWWHVMGIMVLCSLLVIASGCLEQSAEPAPAGEGQPDNLVVVTTAKALRDYDMLRGSDTADNNPVTRWARERLGIVQMNKWILSDQNQGLATRIKLALSSNEEIPDVLFIKDKEIPEILGDLVKSGKIMEVEEAFTRYASPRLKEAYRLNKEVWKTVAYDGKVWGLPQISDEKVGSPILWMRQDWLDRLGLPVPATMEELEAVLHAFAWRDPDGNGKQDTFGLALAGKNTLNGWMGDASLIFGLYGDQPYQWNRDQNGALSYGSIQSSVKEALIHLRDWYERGYLDPDFGTRDEQQAVQLFTSGQAGVLSGPGWMGGWPLQEMLQSVPGAVLTPVPYPPGPDGRISKIGSQLSYGGYFFRRDFAHMDLVFEYLDRVYGALIEDPASDFAHGFGEGYDYLKQDGEVVYDFPGATSTIGNFLLIVPGSVPPQVLQGESIESRVLRGERNTSYERKLASTSSRLFLEGQQTGGSQIAYSRSNQFAGPYTPAMSLKWPLLKKLEKETFLKIVYGKEPADSFETFVAHWLEQGGEAIIREVNEWDRNTELDRLDSLFR